MGCIEVVILVASIIAIGMVFFLPRDVIFGPLILGWVGAAIGVSLAMMYHYDRANDRVRIGDSFPFFATGLWCGLMLGIAIMALYQRRQHLRAWIEVLTVGLLFAGVGAMMGSYVGRGSEDKPPAEIFRGSGFGAVFGLIVGIIQWRVDGRRKVPIDVEKVLHSGTSTSDS